MISILYFSLFLAVGTGVTPRAGLQGAYAQAVDGRVHKLGGEEAAQAGVVVFLGVDCPVSRRYAPRLNELAELAAELDVGFYGVVSEQGATGARARAHADELALAFPVLYDAVGALAARLEPTHVPEAFVVDAHDRLVYRGRIDDAFAAMDRPRARVSSHDLERALRAVAAGEAVETSRTVPIGSTLVDRTLDAPTYHVHVAPVLAAQCVVCHRPGEVGPFTLTSYADARRKARMIEVVCAQGLMPPWRAGPDDPPFLHARRLHERELAALTAWVEAGSPEGDPAAALAAPPAPASGWRLGEPDLVLEIPPFEVPAGGPDIYRHFVLPTGLNEDVYVRAFDLHPGDPTVVHHAIAYLDDLDQARARDAEDEGPGYDAFRGGRLLELWESIGGWAPGSQPYPQPPGHARRMPGNRAIVLEIHYHPDGKQRVDRTQMALYLADEPVIEIFDGVIGTERIDVPAGEAEYWRRVWMELPCDLTLTEVCPHMHQVGTEFRTTATLPDGEVRKLITIDEWDFRWQDTYILAQPMLLPKGTRIEARVRYDNTAANPANPNSPPARVRSGWGTADEMCLFYFSGIVEKERDRRALEWAMFASFTRPADL